MGKSLKSLGYPFELDEDVVVVVNGGILDARFIPACMVLCDGVFKTREEAQKFLDEKRDSQ